MKNFVKRLTIPLLVGLISIGSLDFSIARGGSRSSSSSSGRSSIGSSSRSWSGPRPAAPKPPQPSRNASPAKSSIGGTKPANTAPKPAIQASPAASTATRNNASKPTIGSSKAPASNVKTKPSVKLSAADMAMAKSVKQQGPVRQSRAESTKAYVTANPKLATTEGKTSQFNSFKTEPSTRPSYIPQTTNVNGRPVNIAYNSNYGGYGYIDPTTNMFVNAMAISMIADSAMDYNMAMSGYRYHGDSFNPVVVHRSGWSFFSLFFATIIAIVVVFVIVSVVVAVANNETNES